MKTLAGQFGATIQAYVGHEVRLGADARQGKAWQEDAVKDFQSISSILDCYAVDENSLIALREGNPKLAAGFDWLYPEDRRKELSRAIAAGDQTSWSLFGVSEECGEAIKANFVPEEMKPRCLQPAKNLEVN